MAEYKKAVLSGNYLEIFEYEKKPVIREPGRPQNSKQSSSNGRGYRDNGKRAIFSLRRARRNFIRIARSNLAGAEKPAFLTLTFAKNADLNYAAPHFNRFTQRLTRAFPGIRYLAVPEFQKRGAVHYHVLVWGLPRVVILKERATRLISGIWGHGFIDIIETDGSQKLASYMTKYLFKAIQDIRLVGRRAYMASRNILRPDFNFPPRAIDYIQEIFGNVGIEVLTDRKYPTDWLGWCRYQLLKINPQT